MSFKAGKKLSNKTSSPGKNSFVRYKDILFNKEAVIYLFILLLTLGWMSNYFSQAKDNTKQSYVNEQQIHAHYMIKSLSDLFSTFAYKTYQENETWKRVPVDESQSLDGLNIDDFMLSSDHVYVKNNQSQVFKAPIQPFLSSITQSSPNISLSIHTSNQLVSIGELIQDDWINLTQNAYQIRDGVFYFKTESNIENASLRKYHVVIQIKSESIKESMLRHDVEFWISFVVFFILLVSIGFLLFNKQETNAHRQFLHTVSNTITEGQVMINAKGKIENINTAAQTELGYIESELRGIDFKELIHSDFDIGRHDSMLELRTTMYRKDGNSFIAEITISPIYMSGTKVGYVSVFRNISDEIESKERIERLAFYDTLTSLPNRRMITRLIQESMIESGRNNQWCALFFMDMDNFKVLNDTKGHEAGDIMLMEVARRLTHSSRPEDSAARLGGDEFVFLMKRIGDNEDTARENATVFGQRLLTSLGVPYDINGYFHNSTPSIGVTLFHGTTLDMEELFRRSDMAMYEAKAGGKNNVKFFDDRLLEKITRRSNLDNAMKGCIERGELFCMLQPQVMHSGDLYGGELLMRWRSPELGLVSPGEFIPVAEENGSIIIMGYWILDQACQIIEDWKRKGLPYGKWVLSINVSPLQLREIDFVDRVKDIVMKYDITGSNLKMEITETGTIKNIETVIAKINELKKLGISFSMDDFGTGYSSMTYLRQLPIDQLKIDQSFVKGMTEDTGGQDAIVIVRTIIDMARNLDLAIVAEGVETEEQLTILHMEGCDIYQGYLFGRPQHLDEFESEWGPVNQAH